MTQSFKRPRIDGEYVPVYRPAPDIFPGPDSERFRAGLLYDDWVPNDHTILKGADNRWHAFGITHPAPPPGAGPHEAEWLSFHAATPAGTLPQHLRDGAWKDLPKVLSPADRVGERYENQAPYIIQREGLYYMIYGPTPLRLATSPDLLTWTPQGALFVEERGARDPCVLYWEGTYILVYVTEHSILARTSSDLKVWSQNPVEIFRMRRPGDPESPVLLRHDGAFYLFWCIWDATHGDYDHRTFVFRSENPLDFRDASLVSEIDAHAPEVFIGENNGWYISSAEWPHRGVSIARLIWE